MGINKQTKMKFIALAALVATVSAIPDGEDKLHFFDFDNAKMLYKGDWAAYKKSRPHDNDCSIAESDNWKGAQQCVESWECRGARMCERGGWCSGFDGCEGSPLPTQAPGVSVTHCAVIGPNKAIHARSLFKTDNLTWDKPVNRERK